MPPELITALVGAAIAIVGAIGAIAVFMPPVIKRQMDIHQQVQAAKMESDKQARDDALAAAKQEREIAAQQRAQYDRLIDASINRENSTVQQNEAMVKALTHSVAVQGRQTEILDGMAKELRANTNVTTEGVKTIGELSERTETLNMKVDGLGEKLAAVILNQTTSTETLTTIISEINSLRTSVDVMLSVAKAKLEDVKRSTGDLQTVNISSG